MSEEAPVIELPEGDPNAVMGASRSLGLVGAAVGSVGEAMSGARGAVRAWQGKGSAAFAALADEYEGNARQIVEIATQASIAVRRYAEELADARDELRRLKRREEDCLDRIRIWKGRLADAQRRAEDARDRLAAAWSFTLADDPFKLAEQAAAQRDLDQAWLDIGSATRQLDDARDELTRLRDAAERAIGRVEDAEQAAATQVGAVALGLPGVSMPGRPATPVLSPFRGPFGTPSPNGRMWERATERALEHERLRDELIDGGHVPPPGKLTPEEAQRFVRAYEREHGITLSAMASLALQSRLVQGERAPTLEKSAHLYEEPQWSRDANEFLDAFAAALLSTGPPGTVPGGAARAPRILRRLVSGVSLGGSIDRPLDSFERLASQLWHRELPARPQTSSAPWARYEVEHTGPDNVLMGSHSDDAIWADGYRVHDGFIQESKHVSNADRSPYVADSTYSPTRRAEVLARVEREIERYRAVIRDPNTPARALEIVTNEPRAVQTFEELMRTHNVPGRVVVRP